MIEYHDRGRMKWAGFYLSDHTEKIEYAAAKRSFVNEGKERLTMEEITEILMQAVSKDWKISIQKEERNLEGEYPDDLVGKIQGYDELGIYINGEKIHYDEIRHVSHVNQQKWSAL